MTEKLETRGRPSHNFRQIQEKGLAEIAKVQAKLEKCKDKKQIKRLRNKLSAVRTNLQKAEKNKIVEETLKEKDWQLNGMLNIIEEELESVEFQRITNCLET